MEDKRYAVLIDSDNISSSYIRKNINNEKILKLMNENIVKYIIENNLYRWKRGDMLICMEQ